MTRREAIKTHKALKQKHPEAIVLVRNGDCYETFFEDALALGKTTDLIAVNSADSALYQNFKPSHYMSVFPCKALDRYLVRIIQAGYRVAVVEEI